MSRKAVFIAINNDSRARLTAYASNILESSLIKAFTSPSEGTLNRIDSLSTEHLQDSRTQLSQYTHHSKDLPK